MIYRSFREMCESLFGVGKITKKQYKAAYSLWQRSTGEEPKAIKWPDDMLEYGQSKAELIKDQSIPKRVILPMTIVCETR